MLRLNDPSKPDVELWLEREREYSAKKKVVERIVLKSLGFLLLLISAISIMTIIAANYR